MSEAELIFTALAELSTRQIAKKARVEMEEKTGKKVITGENYLPSKKNKTLGGKIAFVKNGDN